MIRYLCILIDAEILQRHEILAGWRSVSITVHKTLRNEGGCHGSNNCAVVQLECHFLSNKQPIACSLDYKVVTTGPQNFNSRRCDQAAGVGILSANGQDCATVDTAVNN